MSISEKIENILNYLKAEKIRRFGQKHGDEYAHDEIRKDKLGAIMLSELEQVKQGAEEGCPKCKRTRRKYCKKHQRMLLGLDHLAGRIADLYLDKESKWKDNSNE